MIPMGQRSVFYWYDHLAAGLGGLLRQDNVDTFFWQFPVRHSANNDVNIQSSEGVVRE